MVGNTSPPQGPGQGPGSTGPNLPTHLPAYHPQFKINLDQWRRYWQTLFKGENLSDKDVHQMTDQFINFVWNEMNRVLQHALQKQKERDQKEKEDRDS